MREKIKRQNGYVTVQVRLDDGATTEFLAEIIQRDDTSKTKRLKAYNLMIERMQERIRRFTYTFDCKGIPGCDREDLEQEAYLVLFECVKKFNLALCPDFEAFAMTYIKWAVTDHFYAMAGKQRPHYKMDDEARERYAEREECREPKSYEDLKGWCEWFQDKDFWNRGVRPDLRARNILEELSTGDYVEETVIQDDLLTKLPDAMDGLAANERGILMDRFGHKMKWEDIAEKYSVCRKTAQNTANRGLAKLRVAMA